MKFGVIKRLLFKNVLFVCTIVAVENCFENSLIFEAQALTSVKKANAAKDAAVKAEREKWQQRILATQKQIEQLQASLTEATQNYSNLTKEKSQIEQEAVKNLATAKGETEKALSDLQNAQRRFESDKNTLNSSINDLKAQISQKETEKDSLERKIQAAEKARTEYETKVQNEQKSANEKFEAERKNLSLTITKKTEVLNTKINELKQMIDEYGEQANKAAAAEAVYLVEIESLKNEISELKTDLAELIQHAKDYDKERAAFEQDIMRKADIERRHFVDIIIKNQEVELKSLSEIEKLKSELSIIESKQRTIVEAGKALETKLKARIAGLLSVMKRTRLQYSQLVAANRDSELKILAEIDALKSKLNDAINVNKAVVVKAKAMALEKIAEDEADSRVEANRLLQIDSLHSALQDAIDRNNLLVSNGLTSVANAKNFKAEANKKYLQKIVDIKTDLENSNELIRKLINTGAWIKQENYFSNEELVSIFGDIVNRLPHPSELEVVDFADVPTEQEEQFYTQANVSYVDPVTYLPHEQQYQQQYTAQPQVMPQPQYVPQQQVLPQPQYVPQPQVRPQPQYVPQPQVRPQPQYVQQPQVRQQPQYVPQPQVRQQPQYVQQPQVRPQPQYVQQPQVRPQPQYVQQPQARPQPQYVPQPQVRPQPQYVPQPHVRPQSQYVPQPQPQVRPQPQYGPQQQYVTQEEQLSQQSRYIPVHPQPMPRLEQKIADDVMYRLEASAVEKTKEEQLVDFAIDSILNAILKMTNHDVAKTNASMNLIGSGRDLPQKLDAIVDVIRSKFNQEIIGKVFEEIARRYSARKNFVDESLRHIYGPNGADLTNWRDEN